MNYPKLAFTEKIKKLQERYGSRRGYERMEQLVEVEGLGSREREFIGRRDSFYMASTGQNGYPYVQHRGGPKGFVKVLDDKTLAVLDFSGNKQYISVGNIENNNKVSLIMVDYPMRARLKLFAKAEVVSLETNPELVQRLNLGDYHHRAERIFLYHIEAFDWNCPQHITPRYTEEEIASVFNSQEQ